MAKLRKLSAVLASDVVAFSKLVERDEAATLAALRDMRDQVFDLQVHHHGGRIIKLMGDGALVEFQSVVDAVSCAVNIQRQLAAWRTARQGRLPLSLRIGVHLGDVVVDDDDLMGDGINIAARLEQVCPTDGVMISGEVRDQLVGKLKFPLMDIGARRLKNIDRPIRTYAVRWDGTSGRTGRQRAIATGTLAAVAVAAVCLLALARWSDLPARMATAFDRAVGHSISDSDREQKSRLAVFPFENASSDQSQAYFSAGMTEEILVALGRSPLLSVIGRNSTFSGTSGVDPVEAARRLRARYLLVGRAGRSEGLVRVTARLIDVGSGSDLWSEKFDRPLTDLYAVQDEIAGKIAARLDSRIQASEVRTRLAGAAPNVGAYDKLLQARAIRYTDASKEATLRARDLLREAIAQDPGLALAHAELGYTFYRETARQWAPERFDAAIREGLAEAEMALRLDPSLSFASVTMGNLLVRAQDFTHALDFAQRAVAQNPNDPEAYAGLANVLLYSERPADALTAIDKAIVLDPLFPPLYDNYRGRALLFLGRYDEAVGVLRDCARRLPDSWSCKSALATALLRSGRKTEAEQAMRDMAAVAPFKTRAQYERLSSNSKRQTELISTALAELGFPP
jgi:class 3 adenylate cyclase/TolB-like protein/Flp pilus assembly protein TadD